MLIWGSVLVGVDLEINGFDLLIDVVGALMVASALVVLSRIGVGPARSAFLVGLCLSLVVAATSTVDIGLGLNGSPLPAWLELLSAALSVAVPLSLAVGMRHLSAQLGWDAVHSSWETTLRLLVLLTAIPAAVLAVLVVATGSVGEQLEVSPGVFVLGFVGVVIMASPFVHLLVSLVRTRRRAATGTASPLGGRSADSPA